MTKVKTPAVRYVALVEYETSQGTPVRTLTQFFKAPKVLEGQEIPTSVEAWVVKVLKEHGNHDVTVTIAQVLWSISN